MRTTPWVWVGVGLLAFGVLLITGLLVIFPSTTTCIGFLLGPFCAGYYSTMYNGNNFMLGIVLVAAGGLLVIFKGRKGR